MAVNCSDLLKLVLAFILPPLGVYLEVGCNSVLLLNVVLTLLGWLPGIIHAVFIIIRT